MPRGIKKVVDEDAPVKKVAVRKTAAKKVVKKVEEY